MTVKRKPTVLTLKETQVAIKQINEDARMRSEQQLAFVREMSVLTQARCRWCDGGGSFRFCR